MARSCRTAETFRCRIYGKDAGMAFLAGRIRRQQELKKGVFVLADDNTFEFCLPLLTGYGINIEAGNIICITPGEENKSSETAIQIWTRLAETGCSRDSLLVNLGGGVITDMGGFVASTYNRGLSFIHVPTTLLGMVDAAIGGKNALNLGVIKNQVGTFQLPEAVILHPGFLATLPPEHLLSGLAEVAKTALVGEERFWKFISSVPIGEILKTPPEDPLWMRLIMTSAEIKNDIVRSDFRERKKRKVLNFGHTIGHALESFFMDMPHPVSHGQAVAWGMIAESAMAHETEGLSQRDLEAITGWIDKGFGRPGLEQDQVDEVIGLIRYDKKQSAGHARYTLLKQPGKPVINRIIGPETLLRSLSYLTQTELI